MKALFTSLILLSQLLSAQSLPTEEKLKQIDIYLHTVDVGDMVYNNFGHTAVRVHNKLTNQDMVYNWGIFDFADPVKFSFNFYRGDLLYKLGVYPFENAIRHYEYEKRTVWEDKLNLTPAQKKILLQKLAWNYFPENRQYQYQYFFNNCSTKVRDYFDEALNGEIQQLLSSKTTELIYRDTVRQAYETNPEIQLSLELLMNSDIDRKMSEWERMFLPMELRASLLNLEINGEKVISESQTLRQHETPTPFKINSFQMLLIFTTVLSALLFIATYKFQNILLERILLTPYLIIALYFGTLGAMMPLNWLFSGHTDLHHNANIWLIWPTDLLFTWIIIKIIWQGKRFSLSNTAKSNWCLYIKGHWLCYGLAVILYLTGMISQNISWVIMYLIPALAMLNFILYKKINGCEVKI